MTPHSAKPSTVQALPVNHPENFPVASWLCPPHLRPAIAALYAFARAADDIADEGDLSALERQRQLQAFRDELFQTDQASGLRPDIFAPLQHTIQKHRLPVERLNDLLLAFEQDVAASASAATFENTEALLSYCKLSANPVGRLLLHLYGVQTPEALQQSDAICSALQLINFWQDLSEDIPRGRFYVPQDLQHPCDAAALIERLCQQAHDLMRQGAPLVHSVPGRAGWELRLVVQGGLRVLEKVRRLGPRAFQTRPTLGLWDVPLLFWRSLWM